jgi:hypothetical protein
MVVPLEIVFPDGIEELLDETETNQVVILLEKIFQNGI